MRSTVFSHESHRTAVWSKRLECFKPSSSYSFENIRDWSGRALIEFTFLTQKGREEDLAEFSSDQTLTISFNQKLLRLLLEINIHFSHKIQQNFNTILPLYTCVRQRFQFLST